MPTCNAKPGARLGFMRKKRPDGTTYSVPALVGGERCTEFAVVSWFDGSKDRAPLHRALALEA
jgi:hypothetical protein